MSTERVDLIFHGRFIAASIVSLVFQSLSYGAFIVLIPLAVRTLTNSSRSTRSRMFLFATMFTTFFFSSLYLAVKIVEVVDYVNTYIVDLRDVRIASVAPFEHSFAAFAQVNLVLADGIVVWRAWTLCRAEYPKIVTLSVWSLGITAAAAVADSVTNIVQLVPPQGSNASSVIWAINVFNVTTLASSFLANFFATSVVWHKTWNRGLLSEKYNSQTRKSSRVHSILLVLIDSGLIYCGLGLLALVSEFIRLHSAGGKTLGDLLTPVFTQIAGVYPALVIVLIDLQCASEDDDSQPFPSLARDIANIVPAILEEENLDFSTNARESKV